MRVAYIDTVSFLDDILLGSPSIIDRMSMDDVDTGCCVYLLNALVS